MTSSRYTTPQGTWEVGRPCQCLSLQTHRCDCKSARRVFGVAVPACMAAQRASIAGVLTWWWPCAPSRPGVPCEWLRRPVAVHVAGIGAGGLRGQARVQCFQALPSFPPTAPHTLTVGVGSVCSSLRRHLNRRRESKFLFWRLPINGRPTASCDGLPAGRRSAAGRKGKAGPGRRAWTDTPVHFMHTSPSDHGISVCVHDHPASGGVSRDSQPPPCPAEPCLPDTVPHQTTKCEWMCAPGW